MVKIIQNCFSRGQLDYALMGRNDIQAYRKGASKLVNFNIRRHGGISKRHGFDRIMDLSQINVTASTKMRLVPFAYKKNQGFVLLFIPNKVYVIDTRPVDGTIEEEGVIKPVKGIARYVEIVGAQNVYGENEIKEFDYQQCGDVLFIAHTNHPPAKISHTLDTNEDDVFTYEICDFTTNKLGIPSITGATINRQAVSCSGGTKTEEYVVSSVYDGVETLPSEIYRDTNVVNNKKSWQGTTYYMPWTESQTITLNVKVPSRISGGIAKTPEKILVYKKNFNYFGLIGSIDVAKTMTRRSLTYATTKVTAWTNKWNDDPSSLSGYVSPVATSASESSFGIGRTAYETYFNGESALISTQGQIGIGSTTNAKIRFHVGKIHAYESTEGGNLVYNLSYRTWENGAKIKVRLGNSADWFIKSLPNPVAIADRSIIKVVGETTEDWTARKEELLDDFKSQCRSNIETVDISITAQTSKNVIQFCHDDDSKPFVFNKIEAFVGSTNMNFVDKFYTPDNSHTPLEEMDEDIFSEAGNYPSSVSMSQQRLVWASSKNDPARVWLSQTGDLYNYYQHEIMKTDDPIDFVMPVTRFAKINHIAEMRKLIMFNSACEWLVDSSSTTSGITYATIQAYPQSYSGSDDKLKPLICNNSILFASRSCQEVRRFAWDLSNDGFAGRDISIFSSSIFRNNSIKDWTYQQFPHSVIWMPLADGTMASLTIMEEQDVLGWGTHEIGRGGEVVAVATTYAISPHLDEIRAVGDRSTKDYENANTDEIFAVIKRKRENTQDQYDIWLERMRNDSKSEDSVFHSLCMDSVRIYGGTGLGKNRTLPATADSRCTYVSSLTGLEITRNEAAALIAQTPSVEVYEGYRFESRFVSVYPVTGNDVGNGTFDVKDIQNVELMLEASYGGSIGAVSDDGSTEVAEPIRYEDRKDCKPTVDASHRMTFKDCNCSNIKPQGINSRDGRVFIKHDSVHPFTLNMLCTDIATEESTR